MDKLTSRSCVTILFAVSGFAGLAYEVIWFKRFSLVLGNSTLAAGAVVTSFLLGLGAGAQCFGSLADRVKRPLLWYGILESGIGIFAILVPLELSLVSRVSAFAYPYTHAHGFLLLGARLSLAILVIGPPCFFMGGTLPFIVREFTDNSLENRDAAVWLYGVNTLGAAMGCYFTGFHLLPSLGLRATNGIVVILNLGVGLAASMMALGVKGLSARRANLEAEAQVSRKQSEEFPEIPMPLLCISAFLLGCAALMLQIVWTRQLALIVGGSTYAFTAMLFVILLGIALGSCLLHTVLKKYQPNLSLLFVIFTLILVIATILGKHLIPFLTCVVGLAVPLRGSERINALVCVSASVCLELVPALSMGVLLPLLFRLAKHCRVTIAGIIGRIYSCNTAGTMLGGLGASVILLPCIGTLRTTILALVLYLLAAFVILLSQPIRFNRLSWSLAMMTILLVPVIGRDSDPRVTNNGMYMYGYSGRDVLGGTVLHFKEGASCNVLVTGQDGSRALRVNGKVDASTTGDMAMQLGLAYFPRFLHPHARDVLVIGFGSGTTAGASLLFPETVVTCCEVEREVFSAAKYFTNVNHSPQLNGNFSIAFEDGRSYVQGADRRYDLILSEPSNPWMAGVCNLFTLEFYEAAKRKLKPEGIFAQWVQCYSFSVEDYAAVVRTITNAFPHFGLIRISDADTILLASQSDLGLSKRKIDEAQSFITAVSVVRSDLSKYFGTTNAHALLASRYLLDENGLREFLAGVPGDQLVTDSNLRLEFDTPHKIFAQKDRREQINNRLLASIQPKWVESVIMQTTAPKAEPLHALSQLLAVNMATNLALTVVNLGLGYLPNDPKLLADRLLYSEFHDKLPQEVLRNIVRASVEDANSVGVSLWRMKRFSHAAEVFEAVVKEKPNSATSWANLAVNYDALGKSEQAKQSLAKGLAIDPLNAFARELYTKNKTERAPEPGNTYMQRDK